MSARLQTTLAVRLHRHGPPDVLAVEETALPAPGPGEVQLRQTCAGVNFIDIMQRRGDVPVALPAGLGYEATGVVTAVGSGVEALRPGQRVACMTLAPGAYAHARNVDAARVVPIPERLGDEEVAATFFKALTAQYLLHRTARIGEGDVVLVHAAAGGVGQILCRWARHLGATVIGTVGSEAKKDSARAAGCDAVFSYADPDWVAQVLDHTGARKARVVYDSVGAATLMGSLDCAAMFGLVVVYGNASGLAPAVAPELLNRKGCLFLTRPSVFPHNTDPATYRANAAQVFDAMERGIVRAAIGARHALADAAAAHAGVESRAIQGAAILALSQE